MAGSRRMSLKHGGATFACQGQVAFYNPPAFGRADNFIPSEPAKGDAPGVVHYALELLHGFDETRRRLLVGDFLGQDAAAAQRAEIAPSAVALLCRLRQEKVAAVVEVRAFIEVALVALRQEAVLAIVGPVRILREPVLLAYHGMFRQDFYGLHPRGVHGLVFLRSDDENLGQRHLEGYRYVRVLADDASALESEQREPAFQRVGFHNIPHGILLSHTMQRTLLRLMR